MTARIFARLLHSVVLLALLCGFTFSLVELAPGRFLDEMKVAPSVDPASVEAWRERLQLDRPASTRFVEWCRQIVHGDLGVSFSHNRPVASLLAERGANTLVLNLTAILVTWVIAVPWAVWSAARRRETFFFAALQSIPDVVLALLLMYAAVRAGFALEGFALPLSALVLLGLPVVWKHTQSAIADTLDAPFVQAAVADGIPFPRILLRHVLPVAAAPLISLAGLSLGRLLSASLLIEVTMAWPGLGALLMEAVLARDIPLILGAVLCSGTFILLANFAADVALTIADPRIRTE